MITTSDALERMRTRVIVDPETGCHEWRHSMMSGGYGRVRADGIEWLAHRFIYTQLVGPIADGLEIDHLCRNRVCVNVDHLEAVTPRVNTLRGESFAAKNARLTHCKHGHEFSPENTYNRSNGRRMCIACHRASKAKAPRQQGLRYV